MNKIFINDVNNKQTSSNPDTVAFQQKIVQQQQMESIRLIQISLDKLSSSTTSTIQLAKHFKVANSLSSSSSPTILVYKESNLHKNLLVTKILNKSKYFYFQSIMHTMRLSLISKLNYYSYLIQELNNLNVANSSPDTNTDTSASTPTTSSIIEEMKHLMHQILHETCQFNLNISTNDQIHISLTSTTPAVPSATIQVESKIKPTIDIINRASGSKKKLRKRLFDRAEPFCDKNNNIILSDDTNIFKNKQRKREKSYLHANKFSKKNE